MDNLKFREYSVVHVNMNAKESLYNSAYKPHQSEPGENLKSVSAPKACLRNISLPLIPCSPMSSPPFHLWTLFPVEVIYTIST